MKLSAVPSKDLDALSVEQVNYIVFDAPPTEDRPAVAALLLGGSPMVMDSRARAAAELYRRGLVPLVIPTGGVRHGDGRDEWAKSEYYSGKVRAELGFLKRLVDHGEMDDIEFQP